jgi:hypothetical protein
MLTVNDLKNLIAGSGFTPLTIPELQNMMELLAGLIRNMPLRQDQKNALILQTELAELALLDGLYLQSMTAILLVQDTLTSLIIRGTILAVVAASAINLAVLIAEGLLYLISQATVLS